MTSASSLPQLRARSGQIYISPFLYPPKPTPWPSTTTSRAWPSTPTSSYSRPRSWEHRRMSPSIPVGCPGCGTCKTPWVLGNNLCLCLVYSFLCFNQYNFIFLFHISWYFQGDGLPTRFVSDNGNEFETIKSAMILRISSVSDRITNKEWMPYPSSWKLCRNPSFIPRQRSLLSVISCNFYVHFLRITPVRYANACFSTNNTGNNRNYPNLTWYTMTYYA